MSETELRRASFAAKALLDLGPQNGLGELGNGTTENSSVPVAVVGF